MSAVTATLCSTLMFVVFVSAEQKNITAESGQDVTLTCRAPNSNITAVYWKKADLKPKYVLLYQDGLSNSTHLHPSFKNRVDLQDRQMKDGDVSLILKDVTIHDAGTYECHVFMAETDSLEIPSIIYLAVVPPDQKTITAESGQDVTLTCRAANNNIIVVKWSRADLGDEYVLLYRDGHFVPDDQHPSFKNRVDLQDRQMKDGDVSLILKDVTINDAGTYECRVVQRVRGPVTLIISTNLTVVPPGQTGGSVGLIVGLSVLALLLVAAAAVGSLFYRKHKIKKQSQETNQLPAEL
ncbi:V-set and immunoglobulin domain-containing protein 8-like [Simochromis diagramma]|uniref:V-set and immunoglobulin domain-containing protein 8-like n=1 Tax=Simochromis diagramma TaxID=43689 RepID=UPI001A7E956E|nr:V-set and immunoglobulin domain-containing protein 8-like [Simochromis diagramma]